MQLFESLEIALAVLPLVITVGAVAFWWRSLQHRALFATTALLALFGLESLIRHWVVGVAMVNLVRAAGTGVAPDADQILQLVEAAHTKRSIVAILILLGAGVTFLVWLRRAFAAR